MHGVPQAAPALVSTVSSPSSPTPIVVADLDTGIDDALALAYLTRMHHAGEIRLRVSTSAGNCTATQAAANSAEVIAAALADEACPSSGIEGEEPGPVFSGVSSAPAAGASTSPHTAVSGGALRSAAPAEYQPGGGVMRASEGIEIRAGAEKPLVLPLTTTPETHGPTGLGHHRTAQREPSGGDLEALADLWDGAEYLLIAGPATNLEWVLRNRPETLRNLRQLTLMTGAFNYPGNTTPLAEWNAWVDPHALRDSLRLLSDARPALPMPVICPLNVTERVLLEPERLDGWLRQAGVTRGDNPADSGTETPTDSATSRGENAAAGGENTAPDGANAAQGGENAAPDGRSAPLLMLLERALRFYFEFHEQVGVGYRAQIHDLAAAMVMLGTVEFTTREGTVDVEAEGALARGATLVDWDGGYWQRPPNARILQQLDPEAVFAEFERVVLAPPRGAGEA